MKKRFLGIAFCSLLFLLGHDAKVLFAEVIAVEQKPKGFLGNTPTMTMFWQAKEPKAKTSFLLVKGGTATGNVCTDGHHMYRNAHKEVLGIIRGEMSRTELMYFCNG